MVDVKKPKIAYFSMEIGLENSIKTYAGGLGILAGDILKSCADLEVPIIGVSLIHNQGYFEQEINNGRQNEFYSFWNPRDKMTEVPERVSVNIQGRNVNVRTWLYELKGRTGFSVPIYFLDTWEINFGRPWDEDITSRLYGGDHAYHRITQEAILGLGGKRILDKLGFEIETYHMNEGHPALLLLDLLKEFKSADKVREKCVFTTHTPLMAGHDSFSYHDITDVLRNELPLGIEEYAGYNRFNMTELAMKLSRYVNAVSKKHSEVMKFMFPGINIDYITNGVHSYTWTSDEMKAAYDKLIPEWRLDSSNLNNLRNINGIEDIYDAHKAAKNKLFDFVGENYNITLDPSILTIGFARRAATYKRADLIFHNIEELKRIGKNKIQLIFSGKAHPQDNTGKDLIARLSYNIKNLSNDIKAVYLKNYDIDQAKLLTSGVDLWLNTPLRPREASGTSGMKAAHNGVPGFSILDGWWIEGHKEGVTGWSIGPEPYENRIVEMNNNEDADDLYKKLKNIIVPAFYNDQRLWKEIMLNSIAENASYFNTERAVKEYCTKAYNLLFEKI